MRAGCASHMPRCFGVLLSAAVSLAAVVQHVALSAGSRWRRGDASATWLMARASSSENYATSTACQTCPRSCSNMNCNLFHFLFCFLPEFEGCCILPSCSRCFLFSVYLLLLSTFFVRVVVLVDMHFSATVASTLVLLKMLLLVRAGKRDRR